MKNIILQKLNEMIRIQTEMLLIIHGIERTEVKKNQGEDWLDAQDVSQNYHLSARTLLRLRTRGVLPFYKLSGKIYYSKREIDLLISKQKNNHQNS